MGDKAKKQVGNMKVLARNGDTDVNGRHNTGVINCSFCGGLGSLE